ncbi:glutaminyl-peptide cyclotransferase [Aestuariicella hydrocarbonica]|uniref:Glutaminyl-peptide cyclotransferase n=1 Tax=Pseudomaricurvus hydrocarbonicus TaxID=1470433 RepID=A0A9E5MGK8_9GAMM|nr:glutaminyl-peptide cyclotransferase [Aestuariicella hydrocarbonica]NHO64806.1 glutaminyl-peptide cyclotransferase [Aestuariicella hydrocarbonica]
MVFLILMLLSSRAAADLSLPASIHGDAVNNTPTVVRYDYNIVKSLPHSTTSFTQGLVVDQDHIIESSGLYGKSFIHRYHKSSSSPTHNHHLDDDLFAEGIALLQGKLYALTWKSGQAYTLNPQTLERLQTFTYQGEGWGLAAYGNQLVMSNGSSQLTFRNPLNFDTTRTVTVTQGGKAVANLNDLTVFGGLIWANVWYSSDILAIDPDSGRVVGVLPLAELAKQHRSYRRDNVLNGIAWDAQEQGLWVTGKRWNRRYLLKLRRQD